LKKNGELEGWGAIALALVSGVEALLAVLWGGRAVLLLRWVMVGVRVKTATSWPAWSRFRISLSAPPFEFDDE